MLVYCTLVGFNRLSDASRYSVTRPSDKWRRSSCVRFREVPDKMSVVFYVVGTVLLAVQSQINSE